MSIFKNRKKKYRSLSHPLHTMKRSYDKMHEKEKKAETRNKFLHWTDENPSCFDQEKTENKKLEEKRIQIGPLKGNSFLRLLFNKKKTENKNLEKNEFRLVHSKKVRFYDYFSTRKNRKQKSRKKRIPIGPLKGISFLRLLSRRKEPRKKTNSDSELQKRNCIHFSLRKKSEAKFLLKFSTEKLFRVWHWWNKKLAQFMNSHVKQTFSLPLLYATDANWVLQ